MVYKRWHIPVVVTMAAFAVLAVIYLAREKVLAKPKIIELDLSTSRQLAILEPLHQSKPIQSGERYIEIHRAGAYRIVLDEHTTFSGDFTDFEVTNENAEIQVLTCNCPKMTPQDAINTIRRVSAQLDVDITRLEEWYSRVTPPWNNSRRYNPVSVSTSANERAIPVTLRVTPTFDDSVPCIVRIEINFRKANSQKIVE